MAFQLNKSSIPLFALLILSLYSSASAVSSGTASYSEPLYIRLYNGGAACGQYYLVTCVSGTKDGDPPCRDGG
ncbi:hypothetical protein ACOSQ2_031200 [Xanthoceras sorbifolium]